MSQISDNLYLGPVSLPGRKEEGPSSPQLGIGPMGRVFVWDVLPVAALATGLATAQAATGGIVALTAGAGTTSERNAADQTLIVLDTPRNVTLTAAGANATTGLVRGFDEYGQPMSESFAAPSTSTVVGNKAFKKILSITMSGTPGSNVSAGFGEKLGLPVAVRDVVYVGDVKWASALAADAGTFVAAVATNPATPATGDVRGTYTPSSASNGTRRLVAMIALTAIQVGPNATRLGAVGVDQA